MDFVVCVIVAVIFALQCMGTLSGSILAGKTSLQSSTWGYTSLCPSSGNNAWLCYSHYALDGNIGIPSITTHQSNPYWQADLGGFFNVTNITVTSINDFETKLRRAIIEVSTTSVMTTCPELGSTITCGTWPDIHLPGVSITFNCSLSTAVRYVRIRRETTYYLGIAEIKADGVPFMFPGQKYDTVKSKKVTTPVKSLSVARVTECGIMCQKNQPCFAFSFSKHKQQNCLLASDTTMTTDAEWIGYTVSECINVPTTCPPIR